MKDITGYYTPDCRIGTAFGKSIGSAFVVLASDYQALEAEFKNFHRVLCDRFGYGHDPIDWKRDQLSLIEHIATQANPEANAK